jgi:UDP-glucose 4-epimerase
VRALEYLMGGGVSCCLNLSNRRGFSVKEVIKTAEKICDRPVRVEVRPRRMGDPAVLIGDAQRARKVLGWQPNRSELENQISDARNWIMKLKPSMKQKNGTPSLPPAQTTAQFEGGKLWTSL